jgi:hypothetical protein
MEIRMHKLRNVIDLVGVDHVVIAPIFRRLRRSSSRLISPCRFLLIQGVGQNDLVRDE